jgi:hypothetical protein
MVDGRLRSAVARGAVEGRDGRRCRRHEPGHLRRLSLVIDVAFDDEADFTANDLFRATAGLAQVAVRIDCGDDDPFAAQSARFRAAVRPTPAGGESAGGHDDRFWHRMLPGQLDFVGRTLAG